MLVNAPQDCIFFHGNSSFCDLPGSSTIESPNNRFSTYWRTFYAVIEKLARFTMEFQAINHTTSYIQFFTRDMLIYSDRGASALCVVIVLPTY